MCRLLSYVAAEQEIPGQLLADVLPSFTALSSEHRDGWGMAWPGPKGTRMMREPMAANKSTTYGTALDVLAADALLLHLRFASPGSEIAEANTHPFVRDGMAFVHNGHLGPAEQIASMVDPRLETHGETDSELYFLAVLSAMRQGLTPAEALDHTSRKVLALEDSYSANAMLLTDDALHVVCAYAPDRQPSDTGRENFVLRYRSTDQAVVVASTGIAREDWTSLPNGAVLTVSRRTMETTLT